MSLEGTPLAAVAQLGYLLMRAGAMNDARRVWEGVAAQAGHLEAPWRALAVIALRERRFDDCIAAANVANQRQPVSPAPLLLRAEALGLQGRYADARRDLEAVIAMPARTADDRRVLARASAMLG